MTARLSEGVQEGIIRHREVNNPIVRQIVSTNAVPSNKIRLVSDGKHVCTASVHQVSVGDTKSCTPFSSQYIVKQKKTITDGNESTYILIQQPEEIVKGKNAITDGNEFANRLIQQQEEMDADDHFGKIVVMTLKKYRKRKKKMMIRTKIMKLLEEAESDEED